MPTPTTSMATRTAIATVNRWRTMEPRFNRRGLRLDVGYALFQRLHEPPAGAGDVRTGTGDDLTRRDPASVHPLARVVVGTQRRAFQRHAGKQPAAPRVTQ